MDTSDWALRQGHRLIQLGVLLFLAALLVGLIVPKFAVPRREAVIYRWESGAPYVFIVSWRRIERTATF